MDSVIQSFTHFCLQILPLLKSWGATGLLVEYEDSFPYSEELSIIHTQDAYRYQVHLCFLVTPLIEYENPSYIEEFSISH